MFVWQLVSLRSGWVKRGQNVNSLKRKITKLSKGDSSCSSSVPLWPSLSSKSSVPLCSLYSYSAPFNVEFEADVRAAAVGPLFGLSTSTFEQSTSWKEIKIDLETHRFRLAETTVFEIIIKLWLFHLEHMETFFTVRVENQQRF